MVSVPASGLAFPGSNLGMELRESTSREEKGGVATGITKVAKSPSTLLPHLLRKVVT